MDDELNPYASPTSATTHRPRVIREPSRPALSRALTIGLVANAASIPLWFIATYVMVASRRLQLPLLLIRSIDAVDDGLGLWLILGWPLYSVVVLTYMLTADRHTLYWRTKAIVAALMLLLWLVPCGIFVVIVAQRTFYGI
jgi:hypothetical protein